MRLHQKSAGLQRMYICDLSFFCRYFWLFCISFSSHCSGAPFAQMSQTSTSGLSSAVPGEVESCFGWLGSLQHCAPRWWGRRGGWGGSGKAGKSAATAGNTAETGQVQETAVVEGNTVPSPGSRRCPASCPSPQRGRSRRDWPDFGCLIGSFPRDWPAAHCSRRGDWAGARELVARLDAPSPSASGAETVAGQVQQVGCCQVQEGAGCCCVQEQVRCCQGVQVRGSADLVVRREVLCRHSTLGL